MQDVQLSRIKTVQGRLKKWTKQSILTGLLALRGQNLGLTHDNFNSFLSGINLIRWKYMKFVRIERSELHSKQAWTAKLTVTVALITFKTALPLKMWKFMSLFPCPYLQIL